MHCREHVEECTGQISPLSAHLLITCTEPGAKEGLGGNNFLAPPRMLMQTKVAAQMGTLKEFTAGLSFWAPSFLDQNNWQQNSFCQAAEQLQAAGGRCWVRKDVQEGKDRPLSQEGDRPSP